MRSEVRRIQQIATSVGIDVGADHLVEVTQRSDVADTVVAQSRRRRLTQDRRREKLAAAVELDLPVAETVSLPQGPGDDGVSRGHDVVEPITIDVHPAQIARTADEVGPIRVSAQ